MSGRARAKLAAVGLVMLGFALGVFADHLWIAHRLEAHHARELTHSESLIAMIGDLDLNDEQREAVDAVIQRYHARVERHLNEIHPVLASTMDSGRLELEALLTPDQRLAFQDWLRAEHERLTERGGPQSLPDHFFRH